MMRWPGALIGWLFRPLLRDVDAGYDEMRRNEDSGRLEHDGETVTIAWRDCNCEWATKTCDELHVKRAVVPRAALLTMVAANTHEPRG